MDKLRSQRSKVKGQRSKVLFMGWSGGTQSSVLSPQPLSLSSPGFTLLEVMVALTILALGLVTVLELFAGSTRLGVKASQRTQAAIYAQNVMDRLFAQQTLEDGELSGELPNGYVWRARVQEIYPDDDNNRLREGDNQTDFLHLKEIIVSIVWEENAGPQEFLLHSLRAVPEEEGEAGL